jgi:hypothetical protein
LQLRGGLRRPWPRQLPMTIGAGEGHDHKVDVDSDTYRPRAELPCPCRTPDQRPQSRQMGTLRRGLVTRPNPPRIASSHPDAISPVSRGWGLGVGAALGLEPSTSARALPIGAARRSRVSRWRERSSKPRFYCTFPLQHRTVYVRSC